MHSAQFQLHADIEERHWWFVARRRIMRQLLSEVLPTSPDTLVIDIGCGTGANLAALADRYTCVGIDTSAEAVDLARRRFPSVRFMVGLAPGDLGDLIRRARLIMLMDVLEHVADDFAMFSELLAATEPGTHFLVTVPADESLWSEHDESFGHYRRYGRARLESVWADLPVSTLVVSHFNARLLPLVRLARARNRRRGRAAGLAGTDFWLPIAPINRMLTGIMSGEANRLMRVLRRQTGTGYSAGASLIALLRRDEGPVPPRHKPADLSPDHQLVAVG